VARIVLGLASSHTPLLALSAADWAHRAAVDRANPALNLSDGRLLNYAQLLAEVGPRHEDVITAEVLDRKKRACDAAIETLADALQAAAPDVAIIVGDDQAELFGAAVQPALSVFHGDTMVMLDKYGREGTPSWLRQVGHDYLMDAAHAVTAAPAFALEIIGGLIDREVDVTSLALVPDPSRAAFGHAFGFIVKRLFRGRAIPVVPLLLNTYFPPNVPSAARCHRVGRALAEVVADIAGPQRVAVIASGGLSHFVVDEALDRGLLHAMQTRDARWLSGIPRGALNSGSSEILNWVLAAGALESLELTWSDYQPLYRTPAGTGVGAGFAIWKPPEAP
jgi:hypothetical protein